MCGINVGNAQVRAVEAVELQGVGEMIKLSRIKVLNSGGPSENRTRTPVKVQVFESCLHFSDQKISSINSIRAQRKHCAQVTPKHVLSRECALGQWEISGAHKQQLKTVRRLQRTA